MRSGTDGTWLLLRPEASHSWRSAARSAGTKPPQTPCWPMVQCRSASSRHAPRTGQAVQIATASAASRRAASASRLTGNHSSGSRPQSAHRAPLATSARSARSASQADCSRSPDVPTTLRTPASLNTFSAGRAPGTAPCLAARSMVIWVGAAADPIRSSSRRSGSAGRAQGRTGAAGNETVMVSPPPGVSPAANVPCIASVRPRDTASPSPNAVGPGAGEPGERHKHPVPVRRRHTRPSVSHPQFDPASPGRWRSAAVVTQPGSSAARWPSRSR